MLANVGSDFQQFLAAVSVLTMLTPDEAKKAIRNPSRGRLEEVGPTRFRKTEGGDLPGIFLLEDAYRTAVAEAEVVRDLGPRNLVADASPKTVPRRKFLQIQKKNKYNPETLRT